jgi:ribosome-binding protein aMBF1 (putative translation factor)
MHIGERIRAARLSLGMSQAALAEKIGCATLSIINWEGGAHAPLVVYREKLESVLDVSLKEESCEPTTQL